MHILLLLVSLLFIGLTIAALINPKWFAQEGKKSLTRKELGASFLTLFFITYVGSVILTPHKTQSTASSTPTPSPAATPATEKEQIEQLVSAKLSGKTNTEKDRIRRIDVEEQIDGGWGVFVEFNADDNLTTSLRKKGIEQKMSDVYIALYQSGKDIRQASASAYFTLVDKYGHESDGIVYKSILKKEEASKVNFKADASNLRLDILPRVWTTTVLSAEFK